MPMPKIILKSIKVKKIEGLLCEPFKFDLTFDCTKPVDSDIDVEIVYVGNACCNTYDQQLSNISVGPIPVGRIGFEIETDPVKIEAIKPSDLFGVTSVIIIGKYKCQQFFRTGYILNVKYPDIPNEKLDEVDYSDEEIVDSGEEGDESNEGEEGDEYEEGEEGDEYEEGEEGDEYEVGEEGVEEIEEGDEGVEEIEEGDEEIGEGDEGVEGIEKGDEYKEGDEYEEGEEKNEIENKNEINNETYENEKHDGIRTKAEVLKNVDKITEQLKEEIDEEVFEESYLEVKKQLEEKISLIQEENKIVVNGYTLDKTKIEYEFMEPPMITVFDIDWDGAEAEMTIVQSEDETKRMKL